MRKSTRSILQELNDLGVSRNTDLVIESRGSNIIQSAVNLLTLIRENYDLETAAELERRFLNAIRAGDSSKFKRGIQRIQESKEAKKDPKNWNDVQEFLITAGANKAQAKEVTQYVTKVLEYKKGFEIKT